MNRPLPIRFLSLVVAFSISSLVFLANPRQASAEEMNYTGTLTLRFPEFSHNAPISGVGNVIGTIGDGTLQVQFSAAAIAVLSIGSFGTIDLVNESGTLAFSLVEFQTLGVSTSIMSTDPSYYVAQTRLSGHVAKNAGFGGPMAFSGNIYSGAEPISINSAVFGVSIESPPNLAALPWALQASAYEFFYFFSQTYFTTWTFIPTTYGSRTETQMLPGSPYFYSTTLTSVGLSGSNPMESEGRISFSVVSPMAIKRNVPFGDSVYHVGVARLYFEFVPEPGPALLMSTNFFMLIGLRWGRRNK